MTSPSQQTNSTPHSQHSDALPHPKSLKESYLTYKKIKAGPRWKHLPKEVQTRMDNLMSQMEKQGIHEL